MSFRWKDYRDAGSRQHGDDWDWVECPEVESSPLGRQVQTVVRTSFRRPAGYRAPSNANLSQARLWVRRLKNGLSVEHPILGDELSLHQTLSGKPHGPAAVAVSVRARAAAVAQDGVLPGVHSGPECWAAERAPAHAAALVRLPSRRQGYGSAHDARLSRPPRSAPHRALLAHHRPAI